MLKPGTFLLLLLALGIAAGAWLWSGRTENKSNRAYATYGPDETNETKTVPPGETPADLQKQITILEGQVEYLQGQVKAMQDENAALIERMGKLGLKGAPMSDTPSTPLSL